MQERSGPAESSSHNLNKLFQISYKPTYPIIPMRMPPVPLTYPLPCFNHHLGTFDTGEKILPDYNFQSLFRKKSHLRMARNKKKELLDKNAIKNGTSKLEHTELQAKDSKKGHWTNKENKLYHWFLEIHCKHFILKHLRRTDKIFKSMALYIGTRQAQQCRSHHQKMQKKYHNFYQIIFKLRMDFYNTCNEQIIKQQLQDNGINCQDLITEEQLLKGEEITLSGSQHILKEHDSSEDEIQKIEDYGKFEEENAEEGSEPHSNLLEQNYENKLKFNLEEREL